MIRLMSSQPASSHRLARARADGLIVVACDGDHADLSVVWDPVEEQIVDVIGQGSGWSDADDLWLEGRTWAPDGEPAPTWAVAA